MAQSHEPLVHPRWGYQTTLFQLRQPAFWLFAVLLVLTGYLAVIEQSAFADISGSGWALSWGLLLLYAVPVFLLIYVLDLYEREPMSLIIGALLWGGLAATTLSAVANSGWGLVVLRVGGPEFAARWAPALTAPWIEEIMKAAGIVLLYLIARREMDDIMDGFVYGAMIGLGFTLVEDVFYFMSVFGGETGGVLIGFYLRVVAGGLYGHLLYSGLAGMGIAYFVTHRADRPLGRRWAVAGGLFAVAVAGHFLWNSPWLDLFPQPPWTGLDWLVIPGATAVKGLPLLAFAVLMIRMARGRERGWLGAALRTEVGREGLHADELTTLAEPGERRKARKAARGRGGPRAAVLVARLHRQQINLAMVRTRVEEDDHPDLVAQRERCRGLREEVQAAVEGPWPLPAEPGPPPEPEPRDPAEPGPPGPA